MTSPRITAVVTAENLRDLLREGKCSVEGLLSEGEAGSSNMPFLVELLLDSWCYARDVDLDLVRLPEAFSQLFNALAHLSNFQEISDEDTRLRINHLKEAIQEEMETVLNNWRRES